MDFHKAIYDMLDVLKINFVSAHLWHVCYFFSCKKTYALLKAYVDGLHLIQLGLISTSKVNLLDLDTDDSSRFAW